MLEFKLGFLARGNIKGMRNCKERVEGQLIKDSDGLKEILRETGVS